MAGVVYGAPIPPPPMAVQAWKGVKLSWVGWDGEEWPLSDPSSGVFLMRGVRGLGMPQFDRYSSSSPAVAGTRHRGTYTKEREAFWPAYVYSDAGSMDFLTRDSGFWHGLSPDKTGVWTAETPDGKKRSLTLRLSSVDEDPGNDPIFRGWARYGITLIADDPFWCGETVKRSWQEQARRDFLPAAAGAGYYVSSGSTLGSATLTNPGDVDAHVKWTVRGPFSSVSVGVGDALVTAPITAAEGQTLVIDTDPAVQAAFLDGTDVTDQLTSAEFGVLPPGEAVPLSLTMAGTGVITAEFTPRFLRAW